MGVSKYNATLIYISNKLCRILHELKSSKPKLVSLYINKSKEYK